MKNKKHRSPDISRRKSLFLGGAFALSGVAVGTAFYLRRGEKDVPNLKSGADIVRPNDTTGQDFIDYVVSPRYLGSPSAPIQVTEFFSMTCSHCASFHTQTFPRVKTQFIDEGLVRFEMRAFPLDGLALRAHAMARELPMQKYYPMIDLLMKKQSAWISATDPIDALRKIANSAGFSGAEFDSINENRPLLEQIVQMRQDAVQDFDIKATPSFVINNETTISGRLSFEEFAKKINDTAT